MLHTGLTGGVDRSNRSGLSCCSCPVSSGVLHAFVQGELHWSRGSLHVCRGALCGFSSFGLVVCALCPSIGLSRMCRVVALAYGVQDLYSSSDLALCLCLAFDRFLDFLFIRFFSFSFLSCYFMWVFSMHSSRGRLRTMCGLRTDGWSLPGVMSD
jgi:hypothetical protein